MQGGRYTKILDPERDPKLDIASIRHKLIFRNLWNIYSNPRTLATDEVIVDKFVRLLGSYYEPDIYDEEKARNASKNNLSYKPFSISFVCVCLSSLFLFVLGFLFFGWGWGWWSGFYDIPQGRKGRILATSGCICGVILWWSAAAGAIFLEGELATYCQQMVIKSGFVVTPNPTGWEIKMTTAQYDAAYGNFQTSLYEEIRREAFGEDIGQNSWLTAGEQDEFLSWLGLGAGKTLLDVACGAGGPALRVAALTGCTMTGVDVHEKAISTALSFASQRGLESRAEFRVVDADKQLPFPESSFDAITCIDAINHLTDRLRVLTDWARLLKRGGRVLFTNPAVVTGPLTNAEIAVRGSAGFYLFVPWGYDERVINQCGMRVVACEDRTPKLGEIAEGRKNARESRSSALRQVEGDVAYENRQKFLSVVANLAREARLSRYVYVAEKT